MTSTKAKPRRTRAVFVDINVSVKTIGCTITIQHAVSRSKAYRKKAHGKMGMTVKVDSEPRPDMV
jgi:hypothetical protein